MRSFSLNPSPTKEFIKPDDELISPSAHVALNVRAVEVVGYLGTLDQVSYAHGQLNFFLGLHVPVHIVVYIPGSICDCENTSNALVFDVFSLSS